MLQTTSADHVPGLIHCNLKQTCYQQSSQIFSVFFLSATGQIVSFHVLDHQLTQLAAHIHNHTYRIAFVTTVPLLFTFWTSCTLRRLTAIGQELRDPVNQKRFNGQWYVGNFRRCSARRTRTTVVLMTFSISNPWLTWSGRISVHVVAHNQGKFFKDTVFFRNSWD